MSFLSSAESSSLLDIRLASVDISVGFTQALLSCQKPETPSERLIKVLNRHFSTLGTIGITVVCCKIHVKMKS